MLYLMPDSCVFVSYGIAAMAHSCATMRLVVCEPLQVHLLFAPMCLDSIFSVILETSFCRTWKFPLMVGRNLKRLIIMFLLIIRKIICVLYYLQVSKICTNIPSVNSQRAIIRIGNVSSRRLMAATRLPGVRRWEEGGLRAPLLPKAEMELRSILIEKPSKLVVRSCKYLVQLSFVYMLRASQTHA